MNYSIKEKSILLNIPAMNSGKLRFKKRKNRFEFGETFSARTKNFDDTTYLEWQIGYDVLANDVRNGIIKIKLDKKEFIGSNGKRKYPYELSELFYMAIKLNLISITEVKHLLAEISGYEDYIDKKSISIERHSKLTINGLKFEETSIKLPTLFMVETLDGAQIEVSIEKQQYASGVQPMIYFCIPLGAFENHSELSGKSSVAGDELIYIINGRNVSNLINLMKVFGMSSKRHQHDVVEIIKTLLQITE